MAKFLMTKQKFQNQWLRHFAPNLPKDQFVKYVKGQYIWHVFSYNLISFENLFIGDAAREAYNNQDKTECIYCDMFGNSGVSDKISSCNDTAEKVDAEFSELYVVSKDYSWTYIKTHEGNNFGPYFLKITK